MAADLFDDIHQRPISEPVSAVVRAAESESNILRAFEAGRAACDEDVGCIPWSTSSDRRRNSSGPTPTLYLSMKKRPARRSSSWNWELISTRRSTGGCRALNASNRQFPNHALVASIWRARATTPSFGTGRSLRWRAAAGVRRAGAELRAPHRIAPTWDRMSARTRLVSIVTGCEGRGDDSRLGEAHAVDDRHRRRGARRVSGRRRRDRLVQYVHVAAAHRHGDARLRGARRRPRVDRRPRQPCDPAAVLAKMSRHAGVPDQRFSGIGGIHIRTRAELFPARLRHVQVCTAAMLDHAIGPNIIRA